MKHQCVHTEFNLNKQKKELKLAMLLWLLHYPPFCLKHRYPLLLCEAAKYFPINMGNNYTGEKELNYVK